MIPGLSRGGITSSIFDPSTSTKKMQKGATLKVYHTRQWLFLVPLKGGR